MIIVPDYRGHRIEVNAVAVGDRWNASVRIRGTLSQEQPNVDIGDVLEAYADSAERSGEIWARRWIDLKETGSA